MPLTAEQAAALGLEEPAQAPAGRAVPADKAVELGLEDATPTMVTEPAPGRAETAVRHGAQGLTSNFADEIGGFFKALGPDARGQRLGNAYRSFRDQWRKRDDQAAAAYPGTALAASTAGAVGQAFIPGVGAVTRLPGVGGAIAGAGASRADLTTGGLDALAQTGLDAGKGAGGDLLAWGALKGASKGLQKLASGAPQRQTERAVSDLLTGVPAKTVQDPALAKLGGRENIPVVLQREGIPGSVLRGPAAGLEEAVDTRLEDVGQQLGNIYRQADANVPQGILLSSVEKALGKVKAAARERADHKAMAVVDAEIAGLRSLFEESGQMSAQTLHSKVQEFGRRGFARNFLDPTAAAELSRDMHGATRELLQTHVDKVATAFPQRVPGRGQLQELNERYTHLRALGDIAESKALRDRRESPTLSQTLRNWSQMGATAGGAVGAVQGLLSGDMTQVGLSALAPLAVAGATRAPALADEALIRVARAAREGGKAVDVMRMGAQMGLPRSVVAQIIATEDQARTLEQQAAP